MPQAESEDITRAPGLNGATYPALPKPRRKPIRIGRQRRERIEAAVDGLLRLLDELDGNPDEEDGGDLEPTTGPSYADECEIEDPEPSLGWTATIRQEGPNYHGPISLGWHYLPIDAEEEHDGREDDEREPSLGSLENHPDVYGENCSQERWGSSATNDREPDGDELDYSEGRS